MRLLVNENVTATVAKSQAGLDAKTANAARKKMLTILDRIRQKESIGIATVDFGRMLASLRN